MAGVAGAVRTRKARATTLSGHARIATQCDDGTGAGNRKAARCAGAGATGPVSCALCYSRLWADNGKTIRPRCVFLLSPARTATTGLLPGRAEQHLAGQIFSGLTRFDNNTQRPIGDLAHHWETSADGLRWDFYLRSTLHWHNGDAVKASHLHQRLLMLLQLPALDQLFISVKRIEVTHPQCLTFFLHRPDYWLAHRLASYCSHLAHPQFP